MRGIKVLTLGLAAVVAISLAACDDEQPTEPEQQAAQLGIGNNFPQGGHDYQLVIIGVPQDKTATMDNNNGHRIFVQLWSDAGDEVQNPGGKGNNNLAKGGGNDQNQIYLCNSTNGDNDVNDQRCDDWIVDHEGDFGVIDANGTDGDGAIFGLPDPCTDADSTTPCDPIYSVWARTPGNANGDEYAIITTCADETGAGYDGTDDVWCGSNQLELDKQTYHKAVDVSDYLLYMTIVVNDLTDPDLGACIDSGPKGTNDLPDEYDVYLFDNCFENYFWNYDNHGLKVLQLRFYFND